MDVPVAMLPSLGLTAPLANRMTSVQADLIVAQDGLPRAAIRAEPDRSLFMVPPDYTVRQTGIRRLLESSMKREH